MVCLGCVFCFFQRTCSAQRLGLDFRQRKSKKGQVANLIRECDYRTWQQVGDEVKVPLEQNLRSIFQRCAKTDIATRKQIKSILIDCRTSILGVYHVTPFTSRTEHSLKVIIVCHWVEL